MMTTDFGPVPSAPTRGKARIDVLDIMRGIAILGILYINVPYMAAPVAQFTSDIRTIGWTVADRDAWLAINVFWSGTQRCLLQFLFGAGMMMIAGRAMAPDGPVSVADRYYTRNLWLLAFGVFDAVVLLWPGDILHIYAIAAMFLFPFRRLGPKLLLTIGLGWAVMVAIGIPEYGARGYAERTALVHHVQTAREHAQAGLPPSVEDRAAVSEWREELARIKSGIAGNEQIAKERAAHAGGVLPYVVHAWRTWLELIQNWLVWSVIEAVCTMLIGVALWKWGVIQGQRTTRFYVLMTLAAYGFGLTARGIGAAEILSFGPQPKTIWITSEFARLAIGLGHVGAINLAVRSGIGQLLLRPFKAAGRTAFSLYFLQQLIGMYILFSPFGFHLWGRFGWASMAAIATALIVVQVIVANLWMRRYDSGPLEWLWRSLVELKRLPFRRQAVSSPSAAISRSTSAAVE